MIALSLVRVIERHSNELAVELVAKLGASPLPADVRKFRSRNGGDESKKSSGT